MQEKAAITSTRNYKVAASLSRTRNDGTTGAGTQRVALVLDLLFCVA